MSLRIFKTTVCFLLYITLFHNAATAQTTDTVLHKLQLLQSSFVQEIKSFGFKPRLPVPPVIIDNPPSFGNYDDTQNVVHMAVWAPQADDAKDFFESMAQQQGNGETGENMFDKADHKWIFIHEMGHWWRKCQEKDTLPYDEEIAANRIALAYWRENDPQFMAFMIAIFNNVVDALPNPVPDGQTERDYFNNNYNALPGGSAYSWYQSKMILNAYSEQPILSFKEAITTAGYTK